ncbi:MAG: hypothetical protein ACP5I8_16405 [Phycisphaerae bacterium]
MYLNLTFNRIRMAASHNPRQSKIVFINRRLFVLTGAMITTLLAFTVYAGAGGTSGSVFPNLGFTNPRMNFNLGTRVNGVDIAGISPYLPAIPGPLSGWTVTMWHRREILNARELVRNDRNLRDSRLGIPAYAFTTPNHKSHLAIYRDHKTHRWVYELFEKDGPLLPNGGANLFLSAKPIGGGITMNHHLVYNFWAKIAQARIHYYNTTAEKSGAVLAQVFSGFILKFHSRNPGHRITLFMQIHLADSRNWMGRTGGITDEQGAWTPAGAVLDFDLAPPGGYPFRFRSDRGPLHYLRYNLGLFLREVLAAKPPPCRQAGGTYYRLRFAGQVQNLKNWRLTSMYVGLETENRDYRPGARDHRPQGSVSVALQLAGLSVISGTLRTAPAVK